MELGLRISFDSAGRTIWMADAHRGDGKRFVVTTNEKLTAFLELSCLGAVSRHTRNWFGFGRVVSKRDTRMVGGLFKNFFEKQKKVLPSSGIFLSRLVLKCYNCVTF
jgi:hypothetical protein